MQKTGQDTRTNTHTNRMQGVAGKKTNFKKSYPELNNLLIHRINKAAIDPHFSFERIKILISLIARQLRSHFPQNECYIFSLRNSQKSPLS